MAKSSITGFELLPAETRSGPLGLGVRPDEMLRIQTPGGSIYLRRSTVVGAGDSWSRLKRRLAGLAREKGIPYTDRTK